MQTYFSYKKNQIQCPRKFVVVIVVVVVVVGVGMFVVLKFGVGMVIVIVVVVVVNPVFGIGDSCCLEVFKYNNKYLPYTLKDFWSFQYSNLISSKVRDDISKFIVAKALNITDRKFEYFDGHDLTSKEGIPIEVRSASYITPLGENPSKEIEFNIYKNGDTKKIYGFIYIFCLLSHRSKEGLDPLDINQWEFYVTTKSNLEKILNGNEKITLKKLILNNAIESEYENLYKDVIKLCLKEIRNNKR